MTEQQYHYQEEYTRFCNLLKKPSLTALEYEFCIRWDSEAVEEIGFFYDDSDGTYLNMAIETQNQIAADEFKAFNEIG